MNLRTFRIGGVHPEENKITAEVATQVAALPKQAIFPFLSILALLQRLLSRKATR